MRPSATTALRWMAAAPACRGHRIRLIGRLVLPSPPRCSPSTSLMPSPVAAIRDTKDADPATSRTAWEFRITHIEHGGHVVPKSGNTHIEEIVTLDMTGHDSCVIVVESASPHPGGHRVHRNPRSDRRLARRDHRDHRRHPAALNRHNSAVSTSRSAHGRLALAGRPSTFPQPSGPLGETGSAFRGHDAELVALRVSHDDEIVHELPHRGTELFELFDVRIEIVSLDIEMHPILDALLLWDEVEEEPRAGGPRYWNHHDRRIVFGVVDSLQAQVGQILVGIRCDLVAVECLSPESSLGGWMGTVHDDVADAHHLL